MTAPDDIPALVADLAAERDAHPVPHPGCYRCDRAIVASRRAQVGIRRTAPPGTPNRVRLVSVNNGDASLVVLPRGSR